MQLDELYQEIILDHYRNPRHARSIPDGEALIDEENPTCGDHMKLNVRVVDGKVADIEIDCQGCAICSASASIMADKMAGRTVEDAKQFSAAFEEMMRGGPELTEEEMGDLTALSGVREYPLRVKCATMPWHTLDGAFKKLGV